MSCCVFWAIVSTVACALLLHAVVGMLCCRRGIYLGFRVACPVAVELQSEISGLRHDNRNILLASPMLATAVGVETTSRCDTEVGMQLIVFYFCWLMAG